MWGITLYTLFCTFILLLYQQCMYVNHNTCTNKLTFYGSHFLEYEAVQFGTNRKIWWRNVFFPSSWQNSNLKGVICRTAPVRKGGPWMAPNVKYHDDLSQFTCRTLTYLQMRWSTQNVHNASCNIFRVQIGVIFQVLLWGHFGLHQSRTDTLKGQILGFWHKIGPFKRELQLCRVIQKCLHSRSNV